MKKVTTKRILIALFVALGWCTIAEQTLHIFHVEPLKGIFPQPVDISLTFANWISGKYSVTKEKYVNDVFAMRPLAIKLFGQLKFSLFDESSNANVYIGKKHYLYAGEYINAYYGSDYKGEDEIRKDVAQLKDVQDSLQKHGVYLFVVFAPGKGSYYPEYLPYYDLKRKPGPTNYATYTRYCKADSVNYLDFQAWFKAMKDTTKYPLYIRTGIHWSYYGDFMAFDSIVHYLKYQAHFDMPTVQIDSIQLSRMPRFRDYDIGDALNILAPIQEEDLAYPFFSVRDSAKIKPTFLAIADSYYYQMYYNMSPLVFNSPDFWYYGNDLQNLNAPVRHKQEINVKDLALHHQIICLMNTDGTLTSFGCWFIGAAYDAFHKPA
jgi:SGNH hydrolase-like domain, acetyltransferase AlgX